MFRFSLLNVLLEFDLHKNKYLYDLDSLIPKTSTVGYQIN